MTLTLKNTLTRALEPFQPADPAGEVLIYSCGPTVYSFAHIGNFRSFLLADVLRRVLERRGYAVRHVMNITDVGHMTEDHLADAAGEDKLSKAARELGWDPYQVAAHFERAFKEDARLLGLKNYLGAEADDSALHPRATDHIPEMLGMIQTLLDQGVAYTDARGQVYFELARFPEYGTLAGKKLEELEVGSRVAVREEKKDPRDFALWKTDDKHLMQWDPHTGEGFAEQDFRRLQSLAPQGIDARVGKGFPGWHIECSAMAFARLGATIDIHTGGEDNAFPHHECENAQSCAALGVNAPGLAEQGLKSFARYWLHGRHLLVDHRKMSKRDGTFFTVRDLIDPRGQGRETLARELEEVGFPGGKVPAQVLRLALISTSYTLPMNFSFDLLVQARSQAARLQSRFERLLEEVSDQSDIALAAPALAQAIEASRAAFDQALDNNLDVPAALAAACAFVGELNQMSLTTHDALLALRFMQECDGVLGAISHRVRSGVVAKDELEAWHEAPHRAEQALALAGWPQADAERELLALLRAGDAPDDTLLDKLSELDATAVRILLCMRHSAKKNKRYDRADAIRTALQSAGVAVEDLAAGVRFRLP